MGLSLARPTTTVGVRPEWARLAGVTVTAVYAAARLFAATAGNPVITPDSFDYARQSHLSLLDGRFWGSQHPPLLPLLWKLDPAASSALPTRFADVRPLVLVNVGIGVACWAALAFAAASCLERRPVRWAAAAAVLSLSLSPEVAGWDSALLSESLSLSLTALLAAAVVHYVRRPSRWPAVAVAATLAALCASRDTSVVPGVFLTGALVLSVRRQRAILVAGLAVGIALAGWGNHASDQRWKVPLRNSIAGALITGDTHWFAAHGMPSGPHTVGLLLERPTIAFESDPSASRLRSWIDRSGRRTWDLYLLEHPGYVAWPLRNLGAQVDGQTSDDAVYLERSPLLRLSAYGHGLVFWIETAVAAVALLLFRDRRLLAIVAGVLAGAFATIMLVHGLDPIDVQRHLVTTQLSLRLLVVGLVLLLADRVPNEKTLRSAGFF